MDDRLLDEEGIYGGSSSSSKRSNKTFLSAGPGVSSPSTLRLMLTVAALLLLLLNTILLIVIAARQREYHNDSSPSSSASPSSGSTYGNALCASLCSPVCVAIEASCFSTCYQRCNRDQTLTRPGAIGSWLDANAIQHVGITTSNLTRSVAFYTEILGGVEVLGAGGNGWKGDRVYQLLMQAALLRGGAAASWAANLSADGTASMDARYVSFGPTLVEFLDYYSDEAALQRRLASGKNPGRTFPAFSSSNVAPSVATNMHVSFHVQSSRDLNELVLALERAAHDKGYNEVYCDRLTPVQKGPNGRPDVAGVPLEDNSYRVTDGEFQGKFFVEGGGGVCSSQQSLFSNSPQRLDYCLLQRPRWRAT